ncbi:ADP-ribosylglycohydrolase family protein [Ornithinicoccus halotolerans]|uniref:ADP-ribosylglycohydrolase family protein n=1 Tax=Ornithinicoccus halotolerans TaxID=1748220 RepID=UPI00188607BF|nr:ADP-ribosylglycohydrolase family protein [Ornithinicoccus halotolerans]
MTDLDVELLASPPATGPLLARLARRAARVTHTHQQGLDGAAAIAVATHRCLREPAATPPQRPGAAEPAWAAALLGDVAVQLRSVRMREAVQAVADTLALDDPVRVAAVTSTGITAAEAVPAALAAFLHHPADPVAAISFAVRMGGDTDTIATMAGALAGARAGAAALPDDMVGRLEAADRIRGLGAALASTTLG